MRRPVPLAHAVAPDVQRQALLANIADYAQRCPDERATVARFVEFVESQPRCFERSLLQGHVTGSAWLVHPDEQHVLLTHHRKLDIWVQLGGHADGDSDVLGVACREAVEESGLSNIAVVDPRIFDLDVHLIPARAGEPAHYHYDVRYALRVVGGAMGDTRFRVSSESKALAWSVIDGLPALTSEASMLRMALKWQSRTVPNSSRPANRPANPRSSGHIG